MELSDYIRSLPRGGKSNLAKYLKVRLPTIRKYELRQINPLPERAKLIEIYSKKKVTLEEIVGVKKAQEIMEIWK